MMQRTVKISYVPEDRDELPRQDGSVLATNKSIVIISSENRKERKCRVKMVKIEIENNEKMMMVTRNGKFILKKYLHIFCSTCFSSSDYFSLLLSLTN